MRIKKIIDRGYKIPAGYGIAIVDFPKDQLICYPLGLHIIIAVIYRIYCFFAYKFCGKYIPFKIHEKQILKAYIDGYNDAKQKGDADAKETRPTKEKTQVSKITA